MRILTKSVGPLIVLVSFWNAANSLVWRDFLCAYEEKFKHEKNPVLLSGSDGMMDESYNHLLFNIFYILNFSRFLLICVINELSQCQLTFSLSSHPLVQVLTGLDAYVQLSTSCCSQRVYSLSHIFAPLKSRNTNRSFIACTVSSRTDMLLSVLPFPLYIY